MAVGRLVSLPVVVLALLVAATPARADPVYDYATARDGTEIAVAVSFPTAHGPHDGRRWPALFEMDGYGGARKPATPAQRFVKVHASIRGTGCSGGRFDLFSDQTAQDGYDVIERWIVKQPWSNGRVGITGHSYPGLTGLAVAQTAPPHLEAVAVSGLFDDLYRGLLNPGGIPNLGFPEAWGGAARPFLEHEANLGAQAQDPRCRANVAEHGSAVSAEFLLDAHAEPEATEESFKIRRGLMRRIGAVTAPTQIAHQYQDEQSGPRGGPVLWERLRPGLPKRLVLSNGRHSPADPTAAGSAWLRCWVIRDGRRCGAVRDPARRVLFHFDSRKGADGKGQRRGAPYPAADFPAPESRWRRVDLPARTYVSTAGDYHVTGNTGLVFSETESPAAGTFGADSPAQARWTVPFHRTTPIGGPIALTLWATVGAPDTDFFVDVLDHDPRTGELRYLQRGLLRASFRRVDELRSDRVPRGRRKGEIWRPHHPFVDPEALPAGVPQRYELEIYPLGHVFGAGHELVLQLHAPPPNDPLSPGAYAPAKRPARVEVHRASILLAVLPGLPPDWMPASCDRVSGELCLVAPR
jgi:predicted acyl esterase